MQSASLFFLIREQTKDPRLKRDATGEGGDGVTSDAPSTGGKSRHILFRKSIAN